MLLASGCPNAILADGIIGKQVRAAAGIRLRKSCTAPAAVGERGRVLMPLCAITGRRHAKAHESEDRPGSREEPRVAVVQDEIST